MGLSCRDVAKYLTVYPSTVSRIVSLFDETCSLDLTDRKGVKFHTVICVSTYKAFATSSL